MSTSSKRSSKGQHVAHVEDAVEDDSAGSFEGIESTRKYAMSEPLAKERPNMGRSRSDKRPSASRPSATAVELTDNSEPTTRLPERKAKDVRWASRRESAGPDGRAQARDDVRRERRSRDDDEERRARAGAAERESTMTRKTKPLTPKHAVTQPVPMVQQAPYLRGRVAEDPACYGVKQPAPISRPRAQTRPAAPNAAQPFRPQLMGPFFHAGSTLPGPGLGPAPAPFMVGSFPPPPAWSAAGASPTGYAPAGYHSAGYPPASPVGPTAAFFDGSQSHLRQRFDARPSSAMGVRGQAALEYRSSEGYDHESAPRVSRRPLRTKKLDEDARKMPPPNYIPHSRLQSALPPTTPFRPPPLQRPPSRHDQSRPPPPNRRSLAHDARASRGEDFYDDDDGGGLFHDNSPNASFEHKHAVVPRARRDSLAYEKAEYGIVPSSNRSRHTPTYGNGGGAPGGGGMSVAQSKINAALKYQEDVSGGSQMPLTAETLRKATRRGRVPSSRSTRSSGSRDDSDYRRSNTTGMTHSSYGNEEFTIKVPGNTVVRVRDAEIECSNEGGEITWTSRPSGSRAGSDRSSTIYPQLEGGHDDSRSRMERKALPHRPRAPSQADSQSRGYGPTTHAPYDPYEDYV
ncbi:hypothetical protein RJ55_04551 [Drechmeria coniospora]|nr:hypothetical protein RJ55_04551 [Drechmeria coniospora]